MEELFHVTGAGLYCEPGGFHVDPWKPVDRAVITHAHADHARPGAGSYLTSLDGQPILRGRLGDSASIQAVRYGEELHFSGVRVSLHPAGHVLGSAQVRAEYRGEVWVISGDYKVAPDPTCAPFEPVRCHTFVTESTFGLPIYRWPEQNSVFTLVNEWWTANRDAGLASVLYAYSLGKAQRLLAGIDTSIGPVFTHGAVEKVNQGYRASGVSLPATIPAAEATRQQLPGALIIAPPAAQGTPWLRRLGDFSDGFASGWMLLRGARRRLAVDRGFVLSDHADWPELLGAIRDTGAARVLVTHGVQEPLVRYLRESGLTAGALETQFEGEQGSTAATAGENGE